MQIKHICKNCCNLEMLFSPLPFFNLLHLGLLVVSFRMRKDTVLQPLLTIKVSALSFVLFFDFQNAFNQLVQSTTIQQINSKQHTMRTVCNNIKEDRLQECKTF